MSEPSFCSVCFDACFVFFRYVTDTLIKGAISHGVSLEQHAISKLDNVHIEGVIAAEWGGEICGIELHDGCQLRMKDCRIANIKGVAIGMGTHSANMKYAK